MGNRLLPVAGVLFDRQKGKLHLNEAGRIFLERVDRAFVEIDNGVNELLDYRTNHQNRIVLASSMVDVFKDIIFHYLEEHPEFTVFFASGPRITLLDPKLLERVFALHPILHLNQQEITSYTGKEELKAAAEEIHRFTQNTVIVTLGADGCYYYDGEKEETIPGVPAEQLDTIGAGDSHIGAVIAGLQCGKTIEEAIATANRVSAKVVETEGALLSDEAFASLDLL